MQKSHFFQILQTIDFKGIIYPIWVKMYNFFFLFFLYLDVIKNQYLQKNYIIYMYKGPPGPLFAGRIFMKI